MWDGTMTRWTTPAAAANEAIAMRSAGGASTCSLSVVNGATAVAMASPLGAVRTTPRWSTYTVPLPRRGQKAPPGANLTARSGRGVHHLTADEGGRHGNGIQRH